MSRSWTPARLALLIALLALAEWLRATGLSFGLPAVYNPDEVAIMSRALGFAKGDLNPHNFLYPDLLLLRAVRVGRRLVRVQLADRRGVVARRVPDAVLPRSLRRLPRRADARCRLRRGHGVAHVDPRRARGGMARRRLRGAAARGGADRGPRRALREARRAGDAGDRRGDGRAGAPRPGGRGRQRRRRSAVARGAGRRRRGLRRGVLDALLRDLPGAAAGARRRRPAGRVRPPAGIAASAAGRARHRLAPGRGWARR